MLRQLNPAARIVRLDAGELAGAAQPGFDVRAAAGRVSPVLALLPRECEEDGVATLVWRRLRPFHPARLYEALEQLVPAAQRSRGRFWLASRPGIMFGWDAAGGASPWRTAGRGSPACRMRSGNGTHPERRVAAAADWDPRYGDRTQLLAFTAQDLDAGGIWELLDSCLLTGGELAAGEAGWKALPDDFADLLNPVP